MAQGTREISLKNEQGLWGGLRDSSLILPSISGATYSKLTNIYHNRDGTELRRWLGSKVVGRPFLGMLRQVYQVEADTPSAGTARITTGHQWDQSTADNRYPHFGYGVTAGTFLVYFKDNDVIPDGIYTATYVDRYRFTVPVTASGSEAAAAGTGRVFIQRIEVPHILTHAGGRPIVIAETSSADTEGEGDKRNIGSWVGSRILDPSDVLLPGYPTNEEGSELATDDGFISWPSPTVEPHYGDWSTLGVVGSAGTTGDEIVWSMNIRRRMVADVLNRRVIIAVPGWACMFEVNLAREDLPLQMSDQFSGDFFPGTFSDGKIYFANHRFTKVLGIPRGCLITDSAPASGESCMFVAAGFIDPFTGEIGLSSVVEEVQLDSDGVCTVTVATPRNVMGECYGLDIILYVSEPAAVGIEVLFPFYLKALRDDEQVLLDTAAAELETRAQYVFEDVGPASTPAPTIEQQITPMRFPVIEQMPRGASWVRIVRSRMFAGSDSPSSVRCSVVTDTDITVEEVATQAIAFILGHSTQFAFGDLRCDGYVMPPSYEGARFAYYDNLSGEGISVGTEPFGRFIMGMLERKLNETDYVERDGVEVSLFEFDRALPALLSSSGASQYGYLLTDPRHVQFSEEDHPGITPGPNVLPVDTLEGRIPTGMARLGDEAFVFTDRSTHIFQWGLLPRRATSRVLSTQYGCIAPASAVEGPGFVAWLSHEGPMIYSGGGLRWIGAAIVDLWKTFVSESDGQMTNVQGVHDRERNLIIWQLTTEHDDETSDTTKSKTTCNRLLVFNYASETFSLIERPDNGRTHCIGVLPINDSANSRFFWSPAFVAPVAHSAYYEVQFFDDNYSDRSDDPNTFTASADRASGSNSFVTASSVSGPAAGDEAFIRGPNRELRWWGRVASVSGTAIVLDDSGSAAPNTTDGAIWKSGDALENQVIHMQMSSNFLRAGDLGRKISVRGVNVRLALHKRSDATYTTYAWARVRIEKEDGTIHHFTRNAWGDPISAGTTRFKAAVITCEHFKVHVDIISNVQVNLQDVRLEVEPQA